MCVHDNANAISLHYFTKHQISFLNPNLPPEKNGEVDLPLLSLSLLLTTPPFSFSNSLPLTISLHPSQPLSRDSSSYLWKSISKNFRKEIFYGIEQCCSFSICTVRTWQHAKIESLRKMPSHNYVYSSVLKWLYLASRKIEKKQPNGPKPKKVIQLSLISHTQDFVI